MDHEAICDRIQESPGQRQTLRAAKALDENNLDSFDTNHAKEKRNDTDRNARSGTVANDRIRADARDEREGRAQGSKRREDGSEP